MYPDSELTHRVEVFTGHALSPLPLAWDDSANWLWRTAGESPQLLKLARTHPEHDPFWKGMRELFGFDRWRCPETMTRLAGALPAHLPMLPLPMTYLGTLQHAPLWSLPWSDGKAARMGPVFAELLGSQLGHLHRETVSGWGHPLERVHPLAEWPRHARDFLRQHPRCGELPTFPAFPIPSRAVWCLPDVRADQYLSGATGWLWSDWEALTWAPLEFDLCLAEMLITTCAERDAFLAAYRRESPCVSLSAYRQGMRALIWVMRLHGDVDWHHVVSHPDWLTQVPA
ncbi:hypothetical protein [Chromohalobacter israelensis]|uniref:hypothetical protein n=1 Tax=Chromohalobacter israelensis TaxID=141390 RepID=UPI001CC61E96|nr:hypothetical protein [Chromohalobacter salexigens]MBZ5876952.1 hypothetical protein [Chromohalobacter salexigens]